MTQFVDGLTRVAFSFLTQKMSEIHHIHRYTVDISMKCVDILWKIRRGFSYLLSIWSWRRPCDVVVMNYQETFIDNWSLLRRTGIHRSSDVLAMTT
jgi:hypothetical protein